MLADIGHNAMMVWLGFFALLAVSDIAWAWAKRGKCCCEDKDESA